MSVEILDRSRAVGFVGLGNLGLPMALTLLRDGWSVTVLDKVADRAEDAVAAGAGQTAAVADLADCAAVAVAVPDDRAVEELLTGDAGLFARLSAGALVVVHSTILPSTAVRIQELGAAHDVEVMDAPVSGGPERAATGDLTVMVGGAPASVERARPLLETVAAEICAVGPPGAGAAAKLANQLMMFATLAGAYEALDLAAAFGVQEDAILAAVGTSLGDSWVARNWGFFDDMAHAYDDVGTPLRERPWSKDLWDVVATARETGLSLPVAGLLAQHLAGRVEEHAQAARRSEPPHPPRG